MLVHSKVHLPVQQTLWPLLLLWQNFTHWDYVLAETITRFRWNLSGWRGG